jgi:hypothetical protein
LLAADGAAAVGNFYRIKCGTDSGNIHGVCLL